MSLLEAALAAPPCSPESNKVKLNRSELAQRVQLAIAYFEGRVNSRQAMAALGMTKGDQNLHAKLGGAIGTAIRQGIVVAQFVGDESLQQQEQRQ